MARGRLRLLERDGDRGARSSFETHYLESYSLVYNYVFRRMANREATEDVVSEAFLHAARAYDRFDPSRAKFSTWVISIAHNCMNDWWSHHPATMPIDEVPEGAYSDNGRQDEQIANRDLAERLLQALDADERELVALKYYEGKRNVEIAEKLSMNASTVSTRLARAMDKMRAAVRL